MKNTTKYCGRCEQTKSVEEYNFHSTTKDGLQTYCKACNKAYNNSWTKLDPKQKEERKALNLANRIQKQEIKRQFRWESKVIANTKKLCNLLNNEGFTGQFKEIPENPKYIATTDGRVWSLINGKFLKPTDHNLGYKFIAKLTIDDKKALRLLHVVIAHTFLTKPTNGNIQYEINHIDGNKHNNNVNNLEYVTHQQNIQHSWQTGLRNDSLQPVNKYDINGNLLAKYDSIKQATDNNKVDQGSISKCIKKNMVDGNQMTVGGFIWRKSEAA